MFNIALIKPLVMIVRPMFSYIIKHRHTMSWRRVSIMWFLHGDFDAQIGIVRCISFRRFPPSPLNWFAKFKMSKLIGELCKCSYIVQFINFDIFQMPMTKTANTWSASRVPHIQYLIFDLLPFLFMKYIWPFTELKCSRLCSLNISIVLKGVR